MQKINNFAYQALYGDIHNHCNISYAHGSLGDAIKNAALRLDFASITGHASWPDMDEHDPRIQHIVQFHQRGFAKLHRNWDSYLERICKAESEHTIHSGASSISAVSSKVTYEKSNFVRVSPLNLPTPNAPA